VSAESRGAGEGSTFTVGIPGPLHLERTKAPTPVPSTTLPSFSGLSVLVVREAGPQRSSMSGSRVQTRAGGVVKHAARLD
jgi:hypothetical protein